MLLGIPGQTCEKGLFMAEEEFGGYLFTIHYYLLLPKILNAFLVKSE